MPLLCGHRDGIDSALKEGRIEDEFHALNPVPRMISFNKENLSGIPFHTSQTGKNLSLTSIVKDVK